MDFSDEPFWFGNMTEDSRPGALKTIADTRQWMRAFFDGVVRGQWHDLQTLAGSDTLDSMTVNRYGRMGPQN